MKELLILAAALAGFALAGCAAAREKASLAPGDAAPPFELPGSDGKTYRLEDFKGRQAVVVAWFPKASTPG